MFNFNRELRSLIGFLRSTFKCNLHCNFDVDFWLEVEVIKLELERHYSDFSIIFESIKSIENYINIIDFKKAFKIMGNKNEFNILIADIRLIKIKIILIKEELMIEKLKKDDKQ